MKHRVMIFTALIPLLLTGCVSSGKHDMALAEIDTMRLSLKTAQDEINQNQQLIAQTELELEDARLKIASAQGEINRNQQQIELTEQELQAALNTASTTKNDIKNLSRRKPRFNRNFLTPVLKWPH